MNKYKVIYSVLGKIHSAEIVAENKSGVRTYLKDTFDILEIDEYPRVNPTMPEIEAINKVMEQFFGVK